ncbi:VanZ family protein [Clostridium neonatale]|uniref:VanZ family protein n=1 Tax=Clostridium neonatale TaxID=137838 RepID=UPI003D356C73
MFKTKQQKNVTIFLLSIYTFLLIWLVLFKFRINFTKLDHIRNINLIPFHGSMVVNGRISLREIIYNVIVFIPLGIYTSMCKPYWSFVKRVIPSLGITLAFEILQYIFAIGASDITDIIGNTFGGIVGILIYGLFHKIFKDKTINIINVIASIVCILAISMLVLLQVVNM